MKGSSSYTPAPPLGAGLVDLPYGNNARGVFLQRSKLTMPTAPLVQPNIYNSFPTSSNRAPLNRGKSTSFYRLMLLCLPCHCLRVEMRLQTWSCSLVFLSCVFKIRKLLEKLKKEIKEFLQTLRHLLVLFMISFWSLISIETVINGVILR